jgi:Predicted GTPase
VLLSKVDKLSRSEAARVLKATTAQLQDQATVQTFSAQDGTGVEEARKVLERWLANDGGPQ